MAASDAFYDLQDIEARILAMLGEAVVIDGKSVNAQLWPFEQESLPYFWLRQNSFLVDRDTLSSDSVIDRYDYEIGFVIGHISEGYVGEVVRTTSGVYVPAILQYFDKHPKLTTNDGLYKTAARHLYTAERGAIIAGAPSGRRTSQNAGSFGQQHYIGFILEVPIYRNVY